MSVTFQTVSATAATSSNSVVITKPTGLAVGDLMVAHIGKNATGTNTIDTLSGWTSFSNTANGNFRMHIQYKVADSGDASATDFTFTGSGTDPFTGGAIYRLSGFGPTLILDGSGIANWSGTSADLAIGFTPTRASDVYLILVGSGTDNDSGAPGISAYAIATSDPGFSEDYDVRFNNAGSSITRLAGAHATRVQVTATGNVSFSSGGSANSGQAMLLAVANSLDVTVTPSSVTSPSTVNSPTVAGGGTVTISAPVTGSSTVNTPVADQADWSTKDKNATSTFTPASKSSTPTWTPTSKSSTITLTNISKS